MRRNERARSTGPTMGTGVSVRSDSACLPPDSFHPHRHNTFVDQRIVGNIVSENTNPSAMDDATLGRKSSAASQCSSVFSVPYVNISPQEVFIDAPPRTRGVSSSSSQCSLPPTPTRTMFPLRWDTGAGSTNVLCYTKPLSPPPSYSSHDNTLTVGDATSPGRYVNITEVTIAF
ncbi:unnamed protein product [Cylicostephanus goldi]|uniref:Uncharacterized protein n=1 Tax=Cylicostephanus goldi TaxID=71465 RepID=A0A3P7MQE4_CYLGO|nr:unnamed protein product [Cylicostephanus goldi]